MTAGGEDVVFLGRLPDEPETEMNVLSKDSGSGVSRCRTELAVVVIASVALASAVFISKYRQVSCRSSVSPSNLMVAADVHYDAHHPKYAKVKGDIETLWQRPAGEVKGIFFAAHGCCHQGPDYFSEVEPGGWKFDACQSTNCGGCLGLPEEVYFRRTVLSRGYMVVAVSGGAGTGDCWSSSEAPRVRDAIEYVRQKENLPDSLPVFATGSSSGGSLMEPMAAPVGEGGVSNIKCIVPMVSVAGVTERKIPTLHVCMSQDSWTCGSAHQQYLSIKAAGIRAGEIAARPRSLTVGFLSKCLNAELAGKVIKALSDAGYLDDKGMLAEDPRASNWREPVHEAIKKENSDTLVGDKSCLSELMNVAWSYHEFTGEYTEKMLDFCEGKWEGTLAES